MNKNLLLHFLFTDLNIVLDKELENIFILLPIFLGLGAILFFSLSYDPYLINSLITCLVCLIPLYLTYRYRHKKLFYLMILLTAFTMGFLSANVRTIVLKSPTMQDTPEPYKIKATIEQIQLSPLNKRLLLSGLKISNFPNEETPKFIRINTRSDISDLEIGDRIYLKAVLMPPPLPSYPQGFNFSEFAYFKQIGAIGYNVSKIKKINQSANVTLSQTIERTRKAIVERIEKALPKPESGVAAGLLVGFNNLIDRNVYEYIRVSGIAHIIAISGMHIAVQITLTFIFVRALLSRVGQLALYINLKKVSAGIAIIISFIYLMLAGNPISAERAFLMSSLVLIGIIYDRNSSPLRAIAFAAILILISTPEAILSASLQMSFAACIALITSYKAITNQMGKFLIKNKWYSKTIYYAFSVLFSTLIASLATTPFVIYHFNQFSTYSILTNFIAVPLSDFFIMPLGMISLLLMPIGLDEYPLRLMGYGITFMLNYSYYISTLPHASFFIPKLSTLSISLISLGGLMLCLLITHLRYLGLILIIGGIIVINKINKPDIIINHDGKLFAVKGEDDHLYISSNSKARFAKASWQQAYGEPSIFSFNESSFNECNRDYCVIKRAFNTLILFNDYKDLSQFQDIKLIINLTDNNYDYLSDQIVINKNNLSEKGTHAIWLNPKLRIETVKDYVSNRIWNKR